MESAHPPTSSPPSVPGRATLADYLRFARERWWVIVLVTLLFGAMTGYVSFNKTPLYRTSAEMIRQSSGWVSTLLGVNTLEAYRSQRIPADAELVVSPELAERARTRIQSPRSAEELLRMVSVEPLAETEKIRVWVVSPDAAEAARIADGFVQAFSDFRKEEMDAALATSKQVLTEQIAAAEAAGQNAPYTASLQQRLQQLEALTDLVSADYRVLRTAAVPGAPFTPQPVRDTALAVAIGLLLGIALAFLFEYADKRIKDEETLESSMQLPVLASVPLLRKGTAPAGGADAADQAPLGVGFRGNQSFLREPFMMLRSNLQYFKVDRELRLLMVTSALPQHGKTTVAINLALALALSGDSVLLIDCDLRRPRLHSYLGLSNDVGLTSVLSGAVPLNKAVQPVPVEEFTAVKPTPAEGPPRASLFALCAGPIPPNPGELIASKRMLSVLESCAHSKADYVLVDTPPALLVADALTLAQHMDAVLISARLRRTGREEAARLRTLLDRSGAHVLGIVSSYQGRGKGGYYRKDYYRQGYAHGYGDNYGPDGPQEVVAKAVTEAVADEG